MPEVLPCGIYRHWKGRYYLLLGIARHTDTDEELAVYVPLYTDPAHKGPAIQARPLSQWVERVDEAGRVTEDGRARRRFDWVGAER